MTEIPTDAELRKVLRGLKQLDAVGDLVSVTGLSEGTVYRHARKEGAEGQPKTMDANTRRVLIELFAELGVDSDSDLGDMLGAVKEIRARAATRYAGGDADSGNLPQPGSGRRRTPGTGGGRSAG